MPSDVVIARVSGLTVADSTEKSPTSWGRWSDESDDDYDEKASHQ
jgi:hypothetical protein